MMNTVSSPGAIRKSAQFHSDAPDVEKAEAVPLILKSEPHATAPLAPSKAGSLPAEAFSVKAVKLVWCFGGLLASYLTWGYVQEIIMTITYDGLRFPSSTFIVFSNRVLALFVAAALAVSKSCKVIPVMLVGMLVHRKTYPCVEYLEATAITLGVAMFSLAEAGSGEGQEEKRTQLLGLLLVAMYLTCDSFTSQWQDRIFKKFHIDQYQMMLGINCFSVAFTLANLLQTGELTESITFLARHPAALTHIATLSITSTTGQLFIFYTIKNFGPVVFTIIMTCRQMLSMIISCIRFHHAIALTSVAGAMIVFGAVWYRIRRQTSKARS